MSAESNGQRINQEQKVIIFDYDSLFGDKPENNENSIELVKAIKENKNSMIILLRGQRDATGCLKVQDNVGAERLKIMQFSELMRITDKQRENMALKTETPAEPKLEQEPEPNKTDSVNMAEPKKDIQTIFLKQNAEEIIGIPTEKVLYIGTERSFNKTMKDCGFQVYDASIEERDVIFEGIKNAVGKYMALKS